VISHEKRLHHGYRALTSLHATKLLILPLRFVSAGNYRVLSAYPILMLSSIRLRKAYRSVGYYSRPNSIVNIIAIWRWKSSPPRYHVTSLWPPVAGIVDMLSDCRVTYLVKEDELCRWWQVCRRGEGALAWVEVEMFEMRPARGAEGTTMREGLTTRLRISLEARKLFGSVMYEIVRQLDLSRLSMQCFQYGARKLAKQTRSQMRGCLLDSLDQFVMSPNRGKLPRIAAPSSAIGPEMMLHIGCCMAVTVVKSLGVVSGAYRYCTICTIFIHPIHLSRQRTGSAEISL